MRSYSDYQAVLSEINDYSSKCNGLPLVVGIDSIADYRTLLEFLSVDPGKQILRMSDMCSMEFPPHPDFSLTAASKQAENTPVIWIGAAQSLLFYGKAELESFFIKLAGTGVAGPMVLLCPYCTNMLESISQRYEKLGQTIVLLRNAHSAIPAVCMYQNADTCTVTNAASLLSAAVAVIVVVPSFVLDGVTTPLSETVAMLSSSLDQMTPLFVAFSGFTFASNCCDAELE